MENNPLKVTSQFDEFVSLYFAFVLWLTEWEKAALSLSLWWKCWCCNSCGDDGEMDGQTDSGSAGSFIASGCRRIWCRCCCCPRECDSLNKLIWWERGRKERMIVLFAWLASPHDLPPAFSLAPQLIFWRFGQMRARHEPINFTSAPKVHKMLSPRGAPRHSCALYSNDASYMRPGGKRESHETQFA